MSSAVQIPYLQEVGGTKQLIVNGKPFLMLGGELQNSSLSSAEYMDEVWPKMVATNVNTLLGSVTWEMIEPEEDKFDFSELEKVIEGARRHNIRLILLWFGTWKNGKSTYAPSWVKKNPGRFPRAELRKANGVIEMSDTLSMFHEQILEADIKAYTALLKHLHRFDEARTVVMMQIENEVGLLFDSRDACPKANAKFAEPVPSDLVDFLTNDYKSLHEDLKANLTYFNSTNAPKGGSWEEIFGKSLWTDELFMAYNYAHYLDRISAAGKKIYPIPTYTNVWQNYAGNHSENAFPIIAGGGGKPGDYPSGGAVTNVLDIWLRFAPNLDLIAPDIYLNQYPISCAKYRHKNNALLIPEQRRDAYGARRVWVAYGQYQALLASPFGIDTLEPDTNPYTKHYGLLSQVSQIVLEAQREPGTTLGFQFDALPEDWKRGDEDTALPIIKTFDSFKITVERTFVFGKPGPGAGMIIHKGAGRFLLIGWGFKVTGKSTRHDAKFTGILSFKEKLVKDKETGELRTLRTLGGDETRSGQFAMMPNEEPDYGGFPIAVTIPAKTAIAELEFYTI